jgi:signal transduction histidine kinase
MPTSTATSPSQPILSFCEKNTTLKLFIDNLFSGVVCYHKGEIVHANETAFQIFNIKTKDVYEPIKPPSPFLHKSYWAYIEQYLLHQGYPKNKKHKEQIFTADEREIIIEFTIISLSLDDLDMQGVVFEDVTKREQATDEIREKQERYADLLNNMHSAVTIFAPSNGGRDFEIIDVNKKLLKQYKIGKKEVIGLLASQIEKRAQIENLLELMKKVYATGRRVTEMQISFFNDRENKKYYVSLNIFKLKRTDELVLLSKDITTEKEDRLKLKESEQNFRALYDNVSLGVAMFSDEGVLLSANEAFFIQIKKKELKKIDFRKHDFLEYFKEVQTAIFSDFFNVVELGNSLEKEYVVRYKDEEKTDTYLWVHFIPLLKRNRVHKVFVILSDITNRKLLEKELIKAKYQAEEADKLKSSFLANMSHEIRTPLNAIVGFTDILTDENLDDEDKREFAEIIKTSSDHLLHVINSILDISKIETGQVKLFEEQFLLNELLEEVYGMYYPMLRKKGVELRKNIKDETVVVKTDMVKLRQILINLIDNAFKYTKDGYVEVGYRVLGEKDVELYVEDTGAGIADVMHHKIFDQFRQVETTLQPQLGGVGLGLAIVKGYVTKMGGTVNVSSLLGEGSIFTVTLPIIQKSKKIKKVEESDDKIKVDWSDKTVLVVEDYEVNYHYIELMLKESNLNVLHASTGSNAVSLVKSRNDIDLILMDIKLPDIDGFQATKMIKDYNPDIPIIAQTAYALAGDKTKALEKGCDDYVAKPIKKKELYEKLFRFFE